MSQEPTIPQTLAAALQSKTNFPTEAPPFDKLLLENSLYEPIKLTDEWKPYLYVLRFKTFQFDAYCLTCKRSAPFRATGGRPNMTHEAAMAPGEFERTIACARNENHTYKFYFRIDLSGLQKIGQYPSMQSVAGAELRKYRSVLNEDDFNELNKATGLFSHGIGVGSFVYLRRIFERMIDAHRSAQEAKTGSIGNWHQLRMEDRIGALKDILPPALVQNKAVYGILSKGIHELSEEQCKRYFPPVRSAIILILQQDLDNKRQAEHVAELQKQIAAINNEIKGG